MIFKRRWLILSLFLALTIAAAIAAFSAPPTREATAKILMKEDRTSLQISGLSSSRAKTQYSPEALQSELELLKSREVMLPTAQALLKVQSNTPPVQEPASPPWREYIDAALGKVKALVSPYLSAMKASLFGNAEPQGDTQVDALAAQINLLRRKTVAAPVPDTNVIEVSYFAPTAEQAVETLQLILNYYLEQRAFAYGGSAKLLSFYEQEKERAQTDLQVAEEQLKRWQKANSIVAIDQQVTNQLETLAAQERMLQQAQAERVTDPERNPVVTKLKNDIITAEIALHDLLQRYTDEDRRVREKRAQLGLLKNELASAERTVVTSLNSQQDTLRKQIQQASGAVAGLRDKRLEGERLARIVELHKSSFLLYGKNLEEARIAARMEKEQLSNVAVIEQPYAVEDSSGEERMGMIFLAALVGLVLGVAVAFGLEFLNNTLRTQEDVEHYLGLPVLAAIPDLRLRGRYE
ncbi:MAG: GumC family protein [Candidatus Binatia bacterium]